MTMPPLRAERARGLLAPYPPVRYRPRAEGGGIRLTRHPGFTGIRVRLPRPPCGVPEAEFIRPDFMKPRQQRPRERPHNCSTSDKYGCIVGEMKGNPPCEPES